MSSIDCTHTDIRIWPDGSVLSGPRSSASPSAHLRMLGSLAGYSSLPSGCSCKTESGLFRSHSMRGRWGTESFLWQSHSAAIPVASSGCGGLDGPQPGGSPACGCGGGDGRDGNGGGDNGDCGPKREWVNARSGGGGEPKLCRPCLTSRPARGTTRRSGTVTNLPSSVCTRRSPTLRSKKWLSLRRASRSCAPHGQVYASCGSRQVAAGVVVGGKCEVGAAWGAGPTHRHLLDSMTVRVAGVIAQAQLANAQRRHRARLHQAACNHNSLVL
eukprot:scaffold48166_cov60-Phaeocystis_antarctica.AAC.2